MSATPPRPLGKRELRSQIRSLDREHQDQTLSRFPRNPIGIDAMATDLALKSSRLVLELTRMKETTARAARKGGRAAE